jgi:hypothetical protein
MCHGLSEKIIKSEMYAKSFYLGSCQRSKAPWRGTALLPSRLRGITKPLKYFIEHTFLIYIGRKSYIARAPSRVASFLYV